MTVIEDHGDVGDVPAEQLANAHLDLLDARTLCASGRIRGAMALYQAVLDLGPVTSPIRHSAKPR